jgi:hypothetical protein
MAKRRERRNHKRYFNSSAEESTMAEGHQQAELEQPAALEEPEAPIVFPQLSIVAITADDPVTPQDLSRIQRYKRKLSFMEDEPLVSDRAEISRCSRQVKARFDARTF